MMGSGGSVRICISDDPCGSAWVRGPSSFARCRISRIPRICTDFRTRNERPESRRPRRNRLLSRFLPGTKRGKCWGVGFYLPHGPPIVDLFTAVRTFKIFQGGNRIGLTLICSLPVAANPFHFLLATCGASLDSYCSSHGFLKCLLGRNQKIVSFFTSFSKELPFRVNRHSVQICSLNDVKILLCFRSQRAS